MGASVNIALMSPSEDTVALKTSFESGQVVLRKLEMLLVTTDCT